LHKELGYLAVLATHSVLFFLNFMMYPTDDDLQEELTNLAMGEKEKEKN
jgi:hypothetical protein